MSSCGVGRTLGEFRNENQPKEEVFGQTSLRTSRQKLLSGPPNPGKISSLARTCRTDVHKKSLVWKPSGWFFRSLGIPSWEFYAVHVVGQEPSKIALSNSRCWPYFENRMTCYSSAQGRMPKGASKGAPEGALGKGGCQVERGANFCLAWWCG